MELNKIICTDDMHREMVVQLQMDEKSEVWENICDFCEEGSCKYASLLRKRCVHNPYHGNMDIMVSLTWFFPIVIGATTSIWSHQQILMILLRDLPKVLDKFKTI